MEQARIDELIEEARDALDGGDVARALDLTQQLVIIAGSNAEVRAIRTRALLKSRAGEEALDEARLAATLDPESDEVQLLLGLAAWQCNRLTLAQQSLERSVELSGGKAGRLADYAWFMAFERGPRLAEDAALEAVGANDRSSTAWAALGLAQFRLRRRNDAEASLRRALELDPNDPYAQWAMMALLHDLRLDRKAVALSKLLEDTPGTEQLVQVVRQQAKKRQLAKMLVERGIDATPQRQERPYLRWIWLAIATVTAAALYFLVQPVTPLAVFLCLFIPLFIYWCAKLVLD